MVILQSLLKRILEYGDCFNDDGRSFRNDQETSLKVLDLEVKEDNLSAINLYKKFNFQEIGRYPQMFNVNQKYYDALLMNLYID